MKYMLIRNRDGAELEHELPKHIVFGSVMLSLGPTKHSSGVSKFGVLKFELLETFGSSHH